MALAWLVFVGWTIAVFTVVERELRWKAVAVGAGLVAIDSAITRAMTLDTPSTSIVAWLVAEVALYGAHRAMHRVPVLWRFHRLHHVHAPLRWWVAWWQHPIDVVVFSAATAGACWLVGAGLPMTVAWVVGRRVWSVVIHANVRWPVTLIDHVIATPHFHARHHREDLAPANFASTLPAIDRVFGTWAR